MTLKEQIKAYRNDPDHQLSQEQQLLLDTHIDQVKAKIGAYGLAIGNAAPNFILHANEQISLYHLLENGPMVLSFIRGDWCTYCNLQLKAYLDILPRLTELGGQLLLVSLQGKSHQEGMPLLTDTYGQISKAYKVLYPIEPWLAHVYKSLNVDLAIENKDQQWHLPLTATYIIDQKALIRHRFLEADYRSRMSPESILAILEVIH